MKHKEHFSKLLIVGLVIVVSIGALMFFRDRFGMGMFSKSSQRNGSDLVIVNDSSDTISAEYREGDKGAAPVIQPGGSLRGGKGFVRIFTAQKSGSYEVEYTYPRPAGSPKEIKLSQIVAAAKKEIFDRDIMMKEGMIGDIKIEYEEVRDLEVTY